MSSSANSSLFASHLHTWLAAACALALCALASDAHAETQGVRPTSGASEPAAASGVVNLNTATEAELVRLPGVGPSRAKAILELRAHLKKFEKLEDLMRVKGIGRASFRKLRPMLTLEGATTLAAKSASAHRAPANAPPKPNVDAK